MKENYLIEPEATVGDNYDFTNEGLPKAQDKVVNWLYVFTLRLLFFMVCWAITSAAAWLAGTIFLHAVHTWQAI